MRCPLSLEPIRFPQANDRYPELRELELRQLARVLLSSDSGPTLRLLKTKIKSYGHGELPHAEDILSTIYKLMESDESVKETPLPTTTSPNQHASSGDWEGLKSALTSSLASGTFLDSQFYVVESRSLAGLPKIRPIYFCSTVGGRFASNLVTCKFLIRAICGWITNLSFKIRQNSERKEHHILDVQMGMTAILMMKVPTWRVLRSATLAQSCSLIRSIPNSPPRI